MFGLPDKWKERLKGMIKGAPVAPFVEVGDIYSFGKEMFKNYIYDREKKEVLPSGLISYNVQQKKAVPKHGELVKLATTNIGELTPDEQEKKIQQDLDLATSTMPIVGVGKFGSKVANKIASKEIGAVKKTGQKIGEAVSDVVKKTAKKFSDILDNVEATKPAEISKVEPTPTRVQPKVLTGKASTQKYDKLVEPKKGLDDLRGEAKKYKSAEEFIQSQGETLYHGTPAKFEVEDFKGGYLTGDKNYAKVYESPSASSISYGQAGVLNKRSGEPRTLEFVLPKNAKIFDYTNPEHKKLLKDYWGKSSMSYEYNPTKTGQLDWTEGENLREFFDERGIKFDGIKLDEAGGFDPISRLEVKRAPSVLVINPKVLKTKSQLTDIWKESQPLSTNKGTQTLTEALRGEAKGGYKAKTSGADDYYRLVKRDEADDIMKNGLKPNADGYVNLATPGGISRIARLSSVKGDNVLIKVRPKNIDSVTSDSAAVRGKISPKRISLISDLRKETLEKKLKDLLNI